MSGGILRFPWTTQPQVPVGIDWGNPLTRGLKALLVPTALGNKLLNIVPGGTEVTTSGTISRSIGPSGVGQKYGDASGAAAQTYTFPSGYLQTAGSVFWKGQRHASGPAIFRDNQINTTGTMVWGDGASAWNARVNGTTLSGVGSFPVDKDIDFLLTGNSAGSQFYVNGASLGSVGAAWNWNGSTHFKLHGNTGYAQGVLATDYLVAIYDRNLSAAEAKNLSNNPWQLFAPIQRKIWVPNAGGAYTLTADSGSFALTGQDAGLAFNRVLAADTQSYALTGQTTGLAFNRTLAADSGSFALTGQDAGLAFNRVLSAANGSYALDGQDVTLTYTPISGATYTLGAASGSFALTGQDTGLAFNRVLTADTQSYSLSGDVAGLAFNRVLTADTVSYALTGQDASLSYTGFTYKLMADSASFALTGQDASFEFSGTTGVGGGGREKQRKKVLKDIKRLNELILKRDDEPDAEVTTVATPKPKAPKPAKFDTALITAKAKQQVIDDEEDELMLLMY